MKAKNKKQKSILMLVLLLCCIAVVTTFAYIACTKVGQGQSSKVEQNTTVDQSSTDNKGTDETTNADQTDDSKKEDAAETEKADANKENAEQADDTAAGSDKKEEAADASQADKEEVADKDTTETKKEGFFDRNKIQLGLDLQGGVNIVYEAQLDDNKLSDEELAESMAGAQTLIQKRLDANGYTEAEVSIEGSKRLRVDIPGVEDPQKAINEIGAAGMLYFYGQDYMVNQKAEPILTGKNVARAMAGVDKDGKYVVDVQLDDEGTKIFDEYTGSHQGEYIFICLDDQLLSMATLSAHIVDGKGQISGNFTAESAKALANGINAGALPFTLEAISATGVGASLGAEALRSSILAGIIGFILIMIFMIVMYRLCGVAADIALVLYVGLVILVLTTMNATLTLPGIAGILLSIGMAVDANVIIFARIKEELEVGRTVRMAVESGFDKAFRAIIDGNITTLIAAAVLYFFGTGLIKSFATTLIIGIVVSMFTALVITRLVLKAFVGMNIRKPELFAGIKKLGKEA